MRQDLSRGKRVVFFTSLGIQTTIDYYQHRPTLYILSSPGLGSVLYAARDMQRYMRKYGAE